MITVVIAVVFVVFVVVVAAAAHPFYNILLKQPSVTLIRVVFSNKF